MILKNIGPIERLDIKLNNELLFFGDNNSGKTYASYVIYGILKHIKKQKLNLIDNDSVALLIGSAREVTLNVETLKSKFEDSIQAEIIRELPSILSETFNIDILNFRESRVEFHNNEFSNFLLKNDFGSYKSRIGLRSRSFLDNLEVYIQTRYDGKKEIKFILSELKEIKLVEDNIKIEKDTEVNLNKEKDLRLRIIEVVKDMVNDMVNDHLFEIPTLLYIPAERNGINVFRNELMVNRSNMYDKSNQYDVFDVITHDIKSNKVNKSIYPSPISDYISFLNDMKTNLHEEYEKKDTKIWKYFVENIIKGKYEISEDGKDLFFRELYSKKGASKIKFSKEKIPMHIASSSTKTLYGLDFYIENLLSSGDVLMIDEPEMNLDPNSQIKMAKTLSMLASKGVKIILSTHSDYLIKATTNILLENKINEKPSEFGRKRLTDKHVSCYSFTRKKIKYIDSLTGAKFISNFDDPNQMLESEYYNLLDIIEDQEANLDEKNN